MPGVGGLSIANNLLSNTIQLNLNQNESSLKSITKQLSTGLRVSSPAEDPSGFAIATNLETQVQGFDQASQNIQDAQNAATVASGALTSVTSILQQIRGLAVQASSTLLSSADRSQIQGEISQLVSEIDGVANNTQFNGQFLLNGALAGFQPAINASVIIDQNSALNTSANNLVAGVTYGPTDPLLADGTFQLKVVNTGATISTEVFYISSGVAGGAGTLLTTVSGGVAAVYAFGDVTLSISAIGTVDVGSTADVKVLQYVSAGLATIPQVTIQTQANAGGTISFGIGSVSSASLRLGGVNVQATNSQFNNLASEDAIAQVDNAINTVLQLQSNIGAVQVRLNVEGDNDNLASVNLQASESTIADLNVAQASSEYTKDQLLVNFGTTLLAQANTQAQSVLALFR
jgi:flagellin